MPPSQAKNHSSSSKQKIIPFYLKPRRCLPAITVGVVFLRLNFPPLPYLFGYQLRLYMYNITTESLFTSRGAPAHSPKVSHAVPFKTRRDWWARAPPRSRLNTLERVWPTQMPTSPRFTWIQCNLDVVSVNVKDKSQGFFFVSLFFVLFFLPCFDEPRLYCFQFLFWKSKFDEASLTAIKQLK